jgi:hypothetical protein
MVDNKCGALINLSCRYDGIVYTRLIIEADVLGLSLE